MAFRNKNHNIYYLQYSTYIIINLIAAGTIFQTFMLECGVSEAKVSLCVSTFQLLQTFTTLVLSKPAENIKKVLKASALCLFSHVLPLIVMLFLCLKNDLAVNTKYVLLFVFGAIHFVFMGLYSIVCYKVPYHIIDIRDYGEVSGQAGVIGGILGVGVSFTITRAIAKFDYFPTMAIVCILAIVLSIISAGTNFKFKAVKAKKITDTSKKINIFRYKPFYQLLIPTLVRGISTGIFNLMAVIGYHCEVIDSKTATVLVILSQISGFISCQSYAFIAKKHINGLLCLVSSIALAVVLLFMCVGNSSTVFLSLYFVAFFFMNYINYSIPVIVAEFIDYNCLGQYTAWRMGLFTLGSSVGGALVPVFLKYFGAVGTLILCGILMIPCGLGYYIFERNSKRNT